MAQMPPEAPAQGQAPAEGGKDPVEEFKMFVSQLSDGLATASDVAKAMSPGAAEKIGQANALFQEGVAELMQMNGQAPAPKAGGQGVVPPEAGGAKVRPAGPVA